MTSLVINKKCSLDKPKFRSDVAAYMCKTKAYKKWLLFSGKRIEEERKVHRVSLRLMVMTSSKSLNFWRKYAQSRIKTRHCYSVFRRLHSCPCGFAHAAGIKRRIFDIWSKDFVSLQVANRNKFIIISQSGDRILLKFSFEYLQDRWESKLRDRFLFLRTLYRLKDSATINLRVSKWSRTKKILSRNSDLIEDWNYLFIEPDQHDSHDNAVSTNERKNGLLDFFAFIIKKRRNIQQNAFFNLCRLKRQFFSWRSQWNLKLDMHRSSLLALNRYNTTCALGEKLIISRTNQTQYKIFELWTGIFHHRKNGRKRFLLKYFLVKKFHHWIKITDEAPVRRLQQEAINKSFDSNNTFSSFFTPNTAAVIEKMMEKTNRQKDLIATRQKDLKSLKKKKKDLEDKENELNRSNTLNDNSNGYLNTDGSNSIGACSIYNKNNSNISAVKRSASRTINQGHMSSHLSKEEKQRTGNPLQKSYSTHSDTKHIVIPSSSISSLWGSKIIDDCGKNTYFGQYLKKTEKLKMCNPEANS